MTFPNESAEYRAAREKLLEQEIELRRQIEAVAAARRALPPGGELPEDYVFDGFDGPVRFSELFSPGKDSLAIYSFMFPRWPDDASPGPTSPELADIPLSEAPCPACTAFLDQLDGAARHAMQVIDLAVVAKAPVEQLRAYAAERGWRHLRLLSAGESTYHRDYMSEWEDTGRVMPIMNVFERDGDTIRHFWASELFYAPREEGQDPRHAGLLEPLWNLLDLTRPGRPDFEEQITYPSPG